MFKMIDTDNSGHITLEELKTGLERVGADLKDSEISWLMQAVSARFGHRTLCSHVANMLCFKSFYSQKNKLPCVPRASLSVS